MNVEVAHTWETVTLGQLSDDHHGSAKLLKSEETNESSSANNDSNKGGVLRKCLGRNSWNKCECVRERGRRGRYSQRSRASEERNEKGK